jgi:endonuclease/exonuclease/phosphatase (EEP) superfamily protein YafD
MKKVVPIGLASAVTLGSAAAFFGDVWWALDLVANFRVQLAALCLGVLILVALSQSLPATAIAAVGLLLNAAVVLPLYFTPVESARATLTVASFNLLSTNEEHDAVIEWIREVGADVVFLHEGTERWEQVLNAADLPYDVVTTREPHFAFGTIALVPPGSTVTDHGFARTEHRAVEVVVNRITVIGIHPLAPVTAEDAELRNEQLRWVGERARSRSGEAVVVGDFNATPWSHVFRTAFTDVGLLNSLVGSGPAATWRVGTIWQLPIDNAVLTDRLGVVSHQVGPDLGSDHRPLLIEVGPRDFTG